MSTILKSLRKLEEEKKSLDKKLDLKEMMIREDGRPPISQRPQEKPRQRWMGIVMILGGLALFGFIVVLVLPSNEKVTEAHSVEVKTTRPSARAKASPTTPLEGVPLSSIPDFTQRPPMEEDLIDEEFVDEEELFIETMPENTQGIMNEPIELPMVKSIELPSEPAPAVVVEEAPVPSNPQADEQMIAAFNGVPEQKRKTMTPVASVTVTEREVSQETIPGLAIKGIVFFGKGSAESYIFFTLPDLPIQKLKVGQEVEGAKLKGIEPGRALFDYQGKRIELKVGSS